jgi:hypothetical protein
MTLADSKPRPKPAATKTGRREPTEETPRRDKDREKEKTEKDKREIKEVEQKDKEPYKVSEFY